MEGCIECIISLKGIHLGVSKLTLFPFNLPTIVTQGIVPGSSNLPHANILTSCSLRRTSGWATHSHPRGTGRCQDLPPISQVWFCVCVCVCVCVDAVCLCVCVEMWCAVLK